MPVIQPWYDPHFDPGVPAVVSFWASFVGERQRMFDAQMKIRLSRMDNSGLSAEILQQRKALAAMQKIRGEMVAGTSERFDLLLMEGIRGEAQIKAREVAGKYQLEAQNVAARTNIAGMVSEEQMNNIDKATLDEDQEAMLDDVIRDADSQEDPNARDAIYRLGVDRILAQGDYQGGPRRDAIKRELAQNALREGHASYGWMTGDWFGGQHVEEWFSGKYPGMSEAEVAGRMGQVTGGVRSEMSPGILEGIFGSLPAGGPQGGAGTGGAPWTGGAAGTAPGVAPGRASGSAGPAGGGASTSTPPSSPSQAWRQNFMAGIDPTLAGFDTQIADLEANIKRLEAQQAIEQGALTGDVFEGYVGNYLTGPPLFRERPNRGKAGRVQAAIDLLAGAKSADRDRVIEGVALERAGPGRVKRAETTMREDLGVSEVGPGWSTGPMRGGDAAAIPQSGGLPGLIDAGKADPGGFFFDELADRFNEAATIAASTDPDEKMRGIEETMKLLGIVDSMPEGLRNANPEVAAAAANLNGVFGQVYGGEPRVLVEENGTWVYQQSADGSILAQQLNPETGEALANPAPAKGTNKAAIEDLFKKKTGSSMHPASNPDAAAPMISDALDQMRAWTRAASTKDTNHTAELLADLLDPPSSLTPAERVARIGQVGDFADRLTDAGMGGEFAPTVARILFDDFEAKDPERLEVNRATLVKAGDRRASEARQMTREERDAILSVKQEQEERQAQERVLKGRGPPAVAPAPGWEEDVTRTKPAPDIRLPGSKGLAARQASDASRAATLDATPAGIPTRGVSTGRPSTALNPEPSTKRVSGKALDYVVEYNTARSVMDKIAVLDQVLADPMIDEAKKIEVRKLRTKHEAEVLPLRATREVDPSTGRDVLRFETTTISAGQ